MVWEENEEIRLRILVLGESKEMKKRTCKKVGKLQVERRCYVQLIKSFKRCTISCLPLLPFFHFKSEKRFFAKEMWEETN